jgi:hypothetical protein
MEIHKAAKLASKFCSDDICNANETGLFYHAMPDASLSYKYATLIWFKESDNHVIVLYCSNMSGTDKWKLLVIGKRAKPQCIREFVWTV